MISIRQDESSGPVRRALDIRLPDLYFANAHGTGFAAKPWVISE